MEKETVVIFRVDADGEVFALMPEIPASVVAPSLCESYQHVGQHSAANYHLCIRLSRPARPAEYAELLAELERMGYVCRIYQRASYKMHETRMRAVNAMYMPYSLAAEQEGRI